MTGDARSRTLGDVARELQEAARVSRCAIPSARVMESSHSDEAVSELAQAIVLLNRAAARFNSHCGVPDKSWYAREPRDP
jgi:hypothetical protein